MFASNDEINADIDNGRIRNEFLRTLQDRRIRNAAIHCTTQVSVDALCQRILANARRTSELPILDAPRLRSGTLSIIYGAITLAMGAAGVVWSAFYWVDGLAAVALQLVTVCAVIGGVFLTAMGRSLRRGAHLPINLTPADIEQAQHLLDSTAERSRAPADTFSKYVVGALMTLDAAVLLYLVAPLLFPETTPMAQLLIVGTGSFLVARISLEAIAAIAKSARIGQVLRMRALKAADGSPEAVTCSNAIRDAYDGVVGGNWPLRPGWTVYVPSALWAVPLVGLQCLLLGIRLMAGDDSNMIPALGIAGAIAALTTLFAVRTAINAECLSPEIARAKRLLGRFPSVSQLRSLLKADRAFLNEHLARAQDVVTSALQPRVHGEHPKTVGPLALPEPVAVMPTTTTVMPSVRFTPPWTVNA